MPNGVVLKYKGETIASLENSGNLAINTRGNFCEDDVSLEYTAPRLRVQAVGAFDFASYLESYSPESDAELDNIFSNRLTAYQTDYSPGGVQDGVWHDTSTWTNCYNDIYQVEANKAYMIKLGSTVSNRFRVMFTTVDVTQTSGEITGVNILMDNAPVANEQAMYTTSENGYIIIQKTNNSTTGIETFVYEGDL